MANRVVQGTGPWFSIERGAYQCAARDAAAAEDECEGGAGACAENLGRSGGDGAQGCPRRAAAIVGYGIRPR